ncbi:hypothetical protein [Hymenobacter jejuensis]|uniref:DUF1735 domain-containing protein n=1 Tax=Hymenobacter jejuensis TaxID=2502781 RepID=A0A5B7ZZP5_9BACT|nr:hypothetical protein [Hymenobacter jejuensis]QDA60347.1 hypothetical protein FHG12_09615 [Hymenobacter jejuensis]
MKKILFLASLLALFCTVACDKIDKLLTFYLEDSQSIKVGANFPVGQMPAFLIDVPTRSDETFSNNHTRADLVKNVTLNKLTIDIADPKEENFDFLKSIEIYISTNSNDQVLLAALDNVPTGVSSIELKPSGQQLDSYIKAEKYTLTTKAVIRKVISRDITMTAKSRFKVTADPL